MATSIGNSRRRRSWSRRRVAFVLILSFTASWAMLHWVVSAAEVTSNSMSPTLQGEEESGDLVLVDRLSLRHRKPRRGEVVAFESDEGVLVMKRVVGLPGESLTLENGRVLVGGKPHGVAAVDAHEYRAAGFFRRDGLTVQDGRYFVLGDFTSDSYDSRFWGGLEEKRIRGRAIWILWPPERFGPVR